MRSPEDFLESLMPRQPGDKPRAVRPRPVAKRVWASLEREPWEVVAEATLEAQRHDPEHAKRWVVLVDGAEPQLDLVEAGAAAYGVASKSCAADRRGPMSASIFSCKRGYERCAPITLTAWLAVARARR